MSKTKRKRYTGTFKAKVGLEALMGVKTVGQIARDYQVHPVQVTQWKGVIRSHLPELFEPARPEGEDSQELIAQLHEKIGQLTVEADWLKKSASNWGCESATKLGVAMRRTELTTAVRTGGDLAQRVLLRAGAGERGESGVDAAVGRVASGTSGVWESAFDCGVAAGRPGGQSQARGATAAVDGGGGGVSQAVVEFTRGGTADLSLPVGRAGNQRSGSGVVQRHYVRADGRRVHVSGGGDGLVEPVCAGVGVVQQLGQRVLYPGVDGGVGQRPAATDPQHGPGLPVHQRGVSGCGGVGRGGREHGWAGAVDRQPVHRAVMAQRQAGGYLPAGLCRRLDGATRIGSLVYRL